MIPRIPSPWIARCVATLCVPVLVLACSAEEATTPEDQAEEVAAPAADAVLVGSVQGAIGPVTKDYFHRLLEQAKSEGARCIILEMDTPGGLDLSMRAIIKDILGSPIPVVVYVYPSGARAASAGAIIMLASHVAAMAPGTNMGAAHPVAIGQGEIDEEMKAKVTNDAAAYARGLAKERGRDVDWAEKIVRESISSTAEEALALGVIDIIASNRRDLIEQLDGRTVEVLDRKLTLATADAPILEERPSLRERVLARISDPNIAYLLFLLGIFGIFFELQNPGAIFPGVIGGIAILLAFFALQVLPVNYVGVALILLAIVMFLLEIKVPSGGLLTVGGVVAMLIGSIMFIDSPMPFLRVSFSVIIPAVIFTALFFLFAVGMGLRAQKKKVATGYGGITGEVGVAKSNIGDEGSVFVHGEFWNAYADEEIPIGSKVKVIGVEGLRLKVQRSTKKEVT